MHREAFTERSFCTQDAFTHSEPSHREAPTQKLLQTARFYKQQAFTNRKLLHGGAFTQKSFNTQKLLNTANFHTEKSLHREAFTHRGFFTQKLSHRKAFTHTHNLFAQWCQNLQLENWMSAPTQQKDDFETLLEGILKGKSPAPKLRKFADKLSLSQPWCGHSITIYGVQLQKTIVQVVPGQAAGGSFKTKTLVTYRAEQRLCL